MSEDTTMSVWGKREPVSVYQKSKSVWVAVGDYMGKTIEVKSRTRSSALALWADAAKYHGG